MSQSISTDASLVSAAPPAAETTDPPVPALNFMLPSSTPVVVYNISELGSDGYSVVDELMADDTSFLASDALDASHDGDVSTEAEDPEPPSTSFF
jgi:hypothetical protein